SVQGTHLPDARRRLRRGTGGLRGRDDGSRGGSMSSRIHPTVLIDPSAEIDDDVEIGPFLIIGPSVQVGRGARIASRVTLERNVRLAAGAQIGTGSILGGPPQDLKYGGEETWVEIGERSIIREYSTVNRGTTASGITSVGAECFLMSYVHIAHDCQVGDGPIIA